MQPHLFAVMDEKRCQNACSGNAARHPSHKPGIKLWIVQPRPMRTHAMAMNKSAPDLEKRTFSLTKTASATTPKMAPIEPNRRAQTPHTVKCETPATIIIQGV